MLRDFNVQHSDVYRLGLQTEYIQVPDYAVQIFDAFGRTTRGAQGAAIAITPLLESGSAYFYRDLDLRPTIDQNESLATYYCNWYYMQQDIGIAGTRLKQNLGITSQDYEDNKPPSMIDANTPKTILSMFSTAYRTAAGGAQRRKVAAFYGGASPDSFKDTARAPESLEDLFNEDGEWHGIGPDALGSWDPQHPWYNPPNVVKNTNGGATKDTDAVIARKRQRHRPLIYTADNYKSLMGADGDKLSWQLLNRIFGPIDEVTQTPSIAQVWSDGFWALTEQIAKTNNSVPFVKEPMGMAVYAMWGFDVQAIQIGTTTLFPSYKTPKGTIRRLHVGNPGTENGSIFPLYSVFDAPSDAYGDIVRQTLNDLPTALSRFAPIQIPWSPQAFRKSAKHSDALAGSVQLDFVPIVCTMRPFQVELRDLQDPEV